MQSQEQQLILELAGRLKNTAVNEKDAEADTLIQETIANQKDAVYRLVQAVIVQHLALTKSQQDMNLLQEKVQQLESQQLSGKKSASFLDGLTEKLFGRSNTTASPQSSNLNQTQMPSPMMAQQPQQPYSAPNTSGFSSNPGFSSGSSFLGSALTTAAGVAGGMFLFDGIRHMFGGSSASSLGSTAASPVTENVTNNYYGDSDPISSASQWSEDSVPQPELNFDNSSSFDDSFSDDFGSF